MATAEETLDGIREILRTGGHFTGEAIVTLISARLQDGGQWHDGDEEAAYRRRQANVVVVKPTPEMLAHMTSLVERASVAGVESPVVHTVGASGPKLGVCTQPAVSQGPGLKPMGSGRSERSREAWRRAKFLELAVALVIEHPDWTFGDAYQQAARLLDVQEPSSIHTVAACEGGGIELTFESWSGIGVLRAEFLRYRR